MTLKQTPEIIFVAGFPRSGTTWFSNLINSHAKVIYRHEIIGRNYDMFGSELLNALKFNNGLTDEEFRKAIEIVSKADVNTDKPPFFTKQSGLFKFPKLHHCLWLAAKFCPPLKPLYGSLFQVPKQSRDFKVLIKETRSTQNMSSMLTGLRVNHKIFLVRVPQGSIASHLNGIKQGKMGKPSAKSMKAWFDSQLENLYVQKLDLKPNEIAELTLPEYYAIQWTAYHSDLLEMSEYFDGVKICMYEEFVAEPTTKTKLLFNSLNLEFDKAVEAFIAESSGQKKTPQKLLKDSNSDFYSVYRNDSFKVDSWKNKLSQEEVEIIDKHTAPVYEQLNKVKLSQNKNY